MHEARPRGWQAEAHTVTRAQGRRRRRGSPQGLAVTPGTSPSRLCSAAWILVGGARPHRGGTKGAGTWPSLGCCGRQGVWAEAPGKRCPQELGARAGLWQVALGPGAHTWSLAWPASHGNTKHESPSAYRRGGLIQGSRGGGGPCQRGAPQDSRVAFAPRVRARAPPGWGRGVGRPSR